MRLARTLERWTMRSLRTLMLVSALGLPAAVLRGQGPAPAPLPKKSFTNKASFDLPVQMDEVLRTKVQEVRLYVKTPTTAWKVQESGPASLTKFTCRAVEDGEYWYSLATVDRQGRQTPDDVNQEPPSLRVVVDRTPPVLHVHAGNGPDGEPLLHCTATDPNLDSVPPRAVARTSTGDQVLEPLPGQPGTFRLRGVEAASSVRVTASDLAGNIATQELSSRDLPQATGRNAATASAPASTRSDAHPPAGSNSGPVIIDGNPARPQPTEAFTKPQPQSPPPAPVAMTPAPAAPLPVANPPPVEPQPYAPVVQSSYMPSPSHGSYAQGPGTTPPNDSGSRTAPAGNRQLLNTTRACLEYRIDQVGPSGVGKVDVYVTTDQGQSWQRFREITDRRSPAEVDLPGEGTFGVRLVITNGNGFGGTPPHRGDVPDCWIEVDTTGPFVELKQVEVVPQTGQLDIRWRASDKNLSHEPVNLFYRTRPDTPWQVIARNVKNDGVHRWQFPRDIGSHFYFKVEVTDQAGNTARVESPTPIVLDMTEPRASVVSVSASGARPTTATGN